MNRIFLIGLILLICSNMYSQKPLRIDLWPNGAPNSNQLTGDAYELNPGRLTNVSNPYLDVYKPKNPNGTSVVICPGGGYAILAYKHEGSDMVPWLTDLGITVCILHYRMPNTNKEVPLSDAEQTISLVRSHAKEWEIDPNKVGIWGFSAGGHLAASLANLAPKDLRPNFQILFYPVISMTDGLTHGGSRKNLLGDNPERVDIDHFSLEKQVDELTPQAFILHSDDDKAVPVENTLRYYEALRQKKIPAAIQIFPTGGHGWGYNDQFPYKECWMLNLQQWLEQNVF